MFKDKLQSQVSFSHKRNKTDHHNILKSKNLIDYESSDYSRIEVDTEENKAM